MKKKSDPAQPAIYVLLIVFFFALGFGIGRVARMPGMRESALMKRIALLERQIETASAPQGTVR